MLTQTLRRVERRAGAPERVERRVFTRIDAEARASREPSRFRKSRPLLSHRIVCEGRYANYRESLKPTPGRGTVPPRVPAKQQKTATPPPPRRGPRAK